MQKLPRETQLHDDYRQLKDDSEDARYECASFSENDIAELRNKELARIKATVKRLMP